MIPCQNTLAYSITLPFSCIVSILQFFYFTYTSINLFRYFFQLMYLFWTFLVNVIGNNKVNLIRSATFSCLVCVFHLFVKSTWMNMFRYIFDTIVSFEWSFCSTPKFHLVRYLFQLLYLFCTFLSSQLEMFFSVNKLSRWSTPLPFQYLVYILHVFCPINLNSFVPLPFPI